MYSEDMPGESCVPVWSEARPEREGRAAQACQGLPGPVFHVHQEVQEPFTRCPLEGRNSRD